MLLNKDTESLGTRMSFENTQLRKQSCNYSKEFIIFSKAFMLFLKVGLKKNNKVGLILGSDPYVRKLLNKI